MKLQLLLLTQILGRDKSDTLGMEYDELIFWKIFFDFLNKFVACNKFFDLKRK